ncbi:hypothetical protein C8C84_2814 [Flavobacterium sp. 102]|nr:hypothetical protein C8C84_2814 [Flavobacterium sp. 102]
MMESLKEFVWDIIGYLIPGAFLLIVFNFCLDKREFEYDDFLIDWEVFGTSLVVIVSYVLGYLVYSFTKYKIYLQDRLIKFIIYLNYSRDNFITRFFKKRHSEEWKEQFKNSKLYEAAIAKLKVEYPTIDTMEINEVRNILMSKNPTQSETIYTFMFRSSIFDHVSTIFMLVLFIYLIQLFTSIELLKDDIQYKYIYLSMLISVPLLGNSKRFFFPKAMRIPFSNL